MAFCPVSAQRIAVLASLGQGEDMGSSIDCLKEAFAGESQANRKYLAFAEKADTEGYSQVARMFRAAAAAETVHAHAHLRAMGGIGSTKENLEEAVEGETHEFRSMYPEMIRIAESEGNAQALRSFRFANEVEKIHAELYTGFLGTLDKNQDDYPFFVCPVCGHTIGREAPETCPVCGAKGSMYMRID
jgi:rubrerythrin